MIVALERSISMDNSTDSAAENRHKIIALYPKRWDPDIERHSGCGESNLTVNLRIRSHHVFVSCRVNRYLTKDDQTHLFLPCWKNMAAKDNTLPLYVFPIKPPYFSLLFQSSRNSWNTKHILTWCFFFPIGVSVCDILVTHELSCTVWVHPSLLSAQMLMNEC